MGLRLIEM